MEAGTTLRLPDKYRAMIQQAVRGKLPASTANQDVNRYVLAWACTYVLESDITECLNRLEAAYKFWTNQLKKQRQEETEAKRKKA